MTDFMEQDIGRVPQIPILAVKKVHLIAETIRPIDFPDGVANEIEAQVRIGYPQNPKHFRLVQPTDQSIFLFHRRQYFIHVGGGNQFTLWERDIALHVVSEQPKPLLSFTGGLRVHPPSSVTERIAGIRDWRWLLNRCDSSAGFVSGAFLLLFGRSSNP